MLGKSHSTQTVYGLMMFAATLAFQFSTEVSAEKARTELHSTEDYKIRREGNIEVISLSKQANLNLAKDMDDADALIRDVYRNAAPGKELFDYVITQNLAASERTFRRVRFSQVVNGIRLPDRSSILMQANGDLAAVLISRWYEVLEPVIEKSYALELSAKAIADELGVDSVGIDERSSELVYRDKDGRMTPYWKIGLTVVKRPIDFGFELVEAVMFKLGAPDRLLRKFREFTNSGGRGGFRIVRVNASSGETSVHGISLIVG